TGESLGRPGGSRSQWLPVDRLVHDDPPAPARERRGYRRNRRHDKCIARVPMKSASFAWQHEPELGAPFELSPVRDANDWFHPTSHEGSQRRPFAADVDGRSGPVSWRCVEGERALMRAVLTDAIRCL